MSNKNFLLFTSLLLFVLAITAISTALESNADGVGTPPSDSTETSEPTEQATKEDVEDFVKDFYSGRIGAISEITMETIESLEQKTIKGLVDIVQSVAITAGMHGQLTPELREALGIKEGLTPEELKGAAIKAMGKITAAVWSIEYTNYAVFTINGVDWFATGGFTKEVAEKLGALVTDVVATKFSHLQTKKQKVQFALKELKSLQTKLGKIGMKKNMENLEDAWGLDKVGADITNENMAAIAALEAAIEDNPDSGLEVSLSSLAATAALQEFGGMKSPTAGQIGVVEGAVKAGVKAGMSKEEITEATKGVVGIVDELATEGNTNPTAQDVLDRAQEKADVALADAQRASDDLNDKVENDGTTGTVGDISNEGRGVSDSVGDG